MAVASAVSFNAILMAWYGVNFVLGQGLHSYGFGTGGSAAIATLVGLDLLFVAATALRYKMASSTLQTEQTDVNGMQANSGVAAGIDRPGTALAES